MIPGLPSTESVFDSASEPMGGLPSALALASLYAAGGSSVLLVVGWWSVLGELWILRTHVGTSWVRGLDVLWVKVSSGISTFWILSRKMGLTRSMTL